MNEDSKLTEKQKRIIGYRTTEALASSGKKQKELAERLNVTDNTISYFCKGSRTPNLAQIIKIAEFTNVSTDYLLGLSEISSTDPDDRAICERFGLKQKDFDLLVNAFNHREEIADAVIEIRELIKSAEYLRDMLCFGK